MFINKIGQQHLDYGTNCQDYGYANENTKLVCDGCSEGIHSEVGAITFSHLFKHHPAPITERTRLIFDEQLIQLFGQSADDIKNHLCFTIMIVEEAALNYYVSYCGDGYIITQDKAGEIRFQEINDGEYPKYYAYNYVDAARLANYKDGVDFTTIAFSKEEYANVGIASDGLRFIDKCPNYRGEFMELLKAGKAIPLKRFINKHQALFKDDITIAF